MLFGSSLHLGVLLAPSLETFGQPLALLPQLFYFLLNSRNLRMLSVQLLGPPQELLLSLTLPLQALLLFPEALGSAFAVYTHQAPSLEAFHQSRIRLLQIFR